jgi:hypothetical protein
MSGPTSHNIQKLSKYIEDAIDRKINGKGVSAPAWTTRFGTVTSTSPLTIQTADGSEFSTNIKTLHSYTPVAADWVMYSESSEGVRVVHGKPV